MVHMRSVVLQNMEKLFVCGKVCCTNFGAVYSDNGNLGKLVRNFLCPQKGGGKRMPIVAASYGGGNENRALSWPRRSRRQQRLPPPREHRGGKRARKPRGLCALVRAATEGPCVFEDEPQPCPVDRSVYQKFNRSWQVRKVQRAYSKAWRAATILQHATTPSGNREGYRVARARAPQRRGNAAD